jgi:hypothetical protein
MTRRRGLLLLALEVPLAGMAQGEVGRRKLRLVARGKPTRPGDGGHRPDQRSCPTEAAPRLFLPERGAPRPIRLGVKRVGQLDPIPLTLP